MGLTFGVALLVAVLAAICRSEWEAWMPWLAEKLRRYAVRSLIGEQRTRLDEEWASFLQEVPGNVAKIACSIGFVVVSKKISAGKLQRVAIRTGARIIANVFIELSEISLNWSKRVSRPDAQLGQLFLQEYISAKLAVRLMIYGSKASLAMYAATLPEDVGGDMRLLERLTDRARERIASTLIVERAIRLKR